MNIRKLDSVKSKIVFGIVSALIAAFIIIISFVFIDKMRMAKNEKPLADAISNGFEVSERILNRISYSDNEDLIQTNINNCKQNIESSDTILKKAYAVEALLNFTDDELRKYYVRTNQQLMQQASDKGENSFTSTSIDAEYSEINDAKKLIRDAKEKYADISFENE